MSVEKFIISKEETGFTILSNKVLQNLNNIQALGLWCCLASLPHNWTFYKDQLKAHFDIGREKLEKLFSVLKDCNLITITQERDENGRFSHAHIHIRKGDKFSFINKKNKNNDLIDNDTNKSPCAEKPLTANQALVNNHYKEISKKEINKKETKKLFRASHDAQASFEKFWNVYPRKKDRTRAEKIWIRKKYNQSTAEIIEQDVKKRLEQDHQWGEIQYIPYPSTYLNNRRWEDDCTPEARKNAIKARAESTMERITRLCTSQ